MISLCGNETPAWNVKMPADSVSLIVTSLLGKFLNRSVSLSSASASLPSTWTINKIKKLVRGLIISPLDKNTGSLCIS